MQGLVHAGQILRDQVPFFIRMLNKEYGHAKGKLYRDMTGILVVLGNESAQRSRAQTYVDIRYIVEPLFRPDNLRPQALVQWRLLQFLHQGDKTFAFFRSGWSALRLVLVLVLRASKRHKENDRNNINRDLRIFNLRQNDCT